MATRTAELASIISVNTAKIDGHLVANGIDEISFNGNFGDVLSSPGLAAARQAILEATDELHALMLGPAGILTSPSHNFLISLQAIYKFGLATSFPSDKGEATFAQVASYSGLPEPYVRRILRHAMTHRVFCEPMKGVVAHTAASRYLAENPLMRQWIGMVSEEMWPAAVKTVEAMMTWPMSEEPNHSGFNIAHKTENPIFTELSKHPDRECRYAAAMSWFATGPGLEPSYVVNSFPLVDSSEPLIVDVGGSYGGISIALSQVYDSVRCVVLDKCDVVRIGRERLSHGLRDRISFMEHDFFSNQPIKGAEVYLLRWILHDWPDKYAAQILRALIPALKSSARIVLAFDLAMLELHNAKERDRDDWIELFKIADERFEIVNMSQPRGSRLSLIEAVWRGRGYEEESLVS